MTRLPNDWYDNGRMFDDAESAARFLDERGPAGWYRIVNKDRLHQLSSTDCVLGQLYGGDYNAGRFALGLHYNCPAFNGTVSTESWIVEIDKRLAAEQNTTERNSMEPGKTYRFTVEAEYVNSNSENHHFQDATGDIVAFHRNDVSNIEPVNTHVPEVGDVYLSGDGDIYKVYRTIAGDVRVKRTGSTDALRVEDMNFTADELIHRES